MDQWLNKYRVTRRLVVLTGLWMTLEAFWWGAWFATGNARPGLEIAAIIAAVTAPITAYAGWVFRTYTDVKDL